ncbi:alkaline phosphatase [Maribacter polysiphoniae]|uniref:Alkaline phosphatase n=1 Tax=Maribacter polysiphoniae TaxID=429344 RepID=A0A316DJK4_9FLAO|nr:alkaline phosphatase [Maribacter polysiphoniae]MBD1263197.1 alkaline phosphatase [Maribacter polysiphoniae]PWK18105.1 alkaline phosphatase [Maribacter polysiphoniae]
MRLKRIIIPFIVFSLFSCKSTIVTSKTVSNPNNTPKNVILLISDGTGLSQISSAFYYKESTPNYTRFKNIGLINTSSSREDVTDSAAGATAFACGEKTYNGAVGVAADSTNLGNIVELVASKNIKTGVIATLAITHATPACFYAHTFSRDSQEEIASQLTRSNVDFFAGGGLKFFNDRKDGQNLLINLKNNQFDVYTNALTEFATIESSNKIGFLLSNEGMPKMEEGRGDFLSKATELGIQFLSKDDSGFFLMSEGSQIDWGGHANNASWLISELIDFDNVIGKVLDFAEKDGHTLVVVTSDHETGGFTLAAKKKKREDGSEYSDYSEIGPTFSTGGHSATLIPVFAYGPGSEEFKGVYENNEIFHKIMKVTNWGKAK